jgi:hypothetical protein
MRQHGNILKTLKRIILSSAVDKYMIELIVQPTQRRNVPFAVEIGRQASIASGH